jgi:hemerythrin-like metal-binding protein
MIDIEWTPDLCVGMDEIDQQHQQLFAIIAQLLDTRRKDLDRQTLLSALTRLVDYSDYHFRTEDNYMIENEYPLFLKHRKEHLAYAGKVGKLVCAVERDRAALSHEMLAFLCNWWKGHVAGFDMEYARYIHARRDDD